MLPVLLNIGPFPVTSFGLFLSLSLLAAVFVIWRLALTFELNQERVIDLCILTFFGSLIFARLIFVLFNISHFVDSSIHLDRIFFFNRFPGLSFWGAFFGGLLTVFFFSKRLKIAFLQLADIGVVGVFLALSLGSLGCLLGSCQSGFVSQLPVAVPQVGLVGNRFPVQIIEAFLDLVIFTHLWRKSIRFHYRGQIFIFGLLWLGFIKFWMEFLRGEGRSLFINLTIGHLLALLVFITGMVLHYYLQKRSVWEDLKTIFVTIFNSKKRQQALSSFQKKCYNLVISWKVSIQNFRRNFLRRLNVKPNPPKI